MTRAILNAVPEWALLVGVVIALPAIAIGVLLAVRRSIEPWRTDGSSGVVAAVAGMAMTLFALVVALATVTLYDGYRDSSTHVNDEANALGSLARDARGFTPAARDRVDRAVVAYIQVVRDVEFPAMRDGDDAGQRAGVAPTDGLYAAVQAFEPRTESQKAFHASAVGTLNSVVALRRDRISASDSALPSEFAALLILAAAATLITMCFLRTHSLGLDMVLIAIVAVLVGAALLTVVMLEYPFSGSTAVSSDAFTRGILERLLAGGH